MRLESSVDNIDHSIEVTHKTSLYNEFAPGMKVPFELKSLQQNGEIITSQQSIIIEDLRGGGFFGKVIIPKEMDFVIKTSLPNPWRHFWRIVNWDFKLFPAQSDELSAQLEHLSTRVIHLVLPVLSGGKFYSPNSLGYTELSTGFAQVIEKVNGRGPRFDRTIDEYKLFRESQQELLQLGYSLGLEVIGQVHPDNPFGMANLWFDEQNNRLIWLDTIPAIRHTGWVKPFFYFRFHQDIRREFSQLEPTFNRIRTGRFRRKVDRSRYLFDKDSYNKLARYLDLYDRVWENRERTYSTEERQIGAAIRAFAQFGKDILPEVVKFPIRMLIDPIRLIYNDRFRTEFLLSGVEQARKYGLITEAEFQEANQAVFGYQINTPEDRRKYIILKAMLPYYFVTSRILDAIEMSSGLGAIFAAVAVPSYILFVKNFAELEKLEKNLKH